MNLRKKTQIFIIENNPLVSQSLSLLIQAEEDFQVCGETKNIREAILPVERLNPDIVILDLSLGDTDGITLIADLIEKNKEIKILVVSLFDEEIFAPLALQAGAKGYLMKKDAAEMILLALRKILAGGIYLSPTLQNSMMDHPSLKGTLPHEQQ